MKQEKLNGTHGASFRHKAGDAKARAFYAGGNPATDELMAAIDSAAEKSGASTTPSSDGGIWGNLAGIINALGGGVSRSIAAANNKSYTETRNTNITKTNKTLMWGGIGVAAVLVVGVVLILVLKK